MQQYSIDAIVVNDVPGDFDASKVKWSGLSKINTISIIDIELCGRPIGVKPEAAAAPKIAIVWWLIVAGNVIAIAVDDVVVYNNLSEEFRIICFVNSFINMNSWEP